MPTDSVPGDKGATLPDEEGKGATLPDEGGKDATRDGGKPSASAPHVTASYAPVAVQQGSGAPVLEPMVESPAPGDSAAGLEGQVVAGRYRVLGKLGEGGMGTVYLAEHITIEKKVALKVLLHEYARKADLKERFLQEAKAAAKIGHENIVDITDFGPTPDGSVFFAMEFLEGQELSQVIRGEGALPWSRAKPILLQICRGLGAAHSKQIVHRDMKPENIYLIEREGRGDFAKLLDFGIAKMSVDQGERRLTRTGMIFGTPEYMSPEQAQGSKPDHRVDIYAMGVIMYEMLTGTVPFKADTFMGILTKHIFENPVPPSQANPEAEIPAEVEEIILRALAKDRTERFQSMTEMAAAIAQASGRLTRPTGDVEQLPPRRIASPSQTYAAISRAGIAPALAPAPSEDLEFPARNRRAGLVTGVLGVAALVGVGALVLSQRGSDEAKAPGPPAGVKTAPAPKARAAPPPVARVEIIVTSKPPGASVYLGAATDGKAPKGVTPASLSLPRSDKKILLTLRVKDHEDGALELVPNRDKELFTRLVPVKPPPAARRAPRRAKKASRPGAAGARVGARSARRRHPRPARRRKPEKPKRGAPEGRGADRVNDLMNPFD